MKYSKSEILEKMKSVNSWIELQISIKDVYSAFSEDERDDSKNDQPGLMEELKELREKNARLMDTNKQLRAENKNLRASK